jgi:hypothetical protein
MKGKRMMQAHTPTGHRNGSSVLIAIINELQIKEVKR